MKQILKHIRLVIVLSALLMPIFVLAQPGGFDDDVEDNPIPFDGGVSLLIAAGLGYGLKKAYDKKKEEKQ